MRVITVLFFISLVNLFANNLEIVYEERKPYIIKDGNSIKGLVATPLMKALSNGSIEYSLKEKPSKRHLHEIKFKQKAVCAIGWFKNSEREKFGLYTKALYQDKPMGLLTRKDFIKSKEVDLDSLMKKNDCTLLTKQSYSYGKTLDEKIKNYSAKKQEVNSNNTNMLMMIAFERADYMFISYEEALELLKSHPQKEKLEFKKIKGIPDGNKRYLICSKETDTKIIDSINNYL